MDLKQQLIDFGCGEEFVEIALGYAQYYQPQQDIETFIEYVEEAHAKVEEAEEVEKIDPEILNTSGLIEVIKGEEER
jgi:hypothetical protein